MKHPLGGKRFFLPLGGREKLFKNLRIDLIALVLALMLFAYIGSAVEMHSLQPFSPIVTDSMEPAIGQGSIAFVKRVPASELAVGDIIVFFIAEELRPPGYPSMRLAHRVVRVEKDPSAGLVFWTKGDALDEMDPFGTRARLVQGKVVYSIPFLGYVFHIQRFFTSPAGWTFLGMAVVLWILIFHPHVLRRWGNTIVTGQITTSDPQFVELIRELEESRKQDRQVLADFTAQIQAHLKAVRGIGEAAEELTKAAKELNKKSSARKRRNKRK